MKNTIKKALCLTLATAMITSGFTAMAAEGTGSLDVLKVAVQNMPKSMDPGTGISNAMLSVAPSVFDTVMYKDGLAENEVKSYICESWEVIDETTVEIKIKEGITFHNGEALIAEDIEYTIERAVFGDSTYFDASLTAILPNLKDVEVIDDYTLRVVMESSDSVLIDRLTSVMGFYIIPKDYVEEVGDEAFGLAPVGTGPYKVVEFSPNKLVLEYYDGYYGEKPAADRIEFYYYPEVSTRLTSLLNGEVDIALGLTPENVETVENSGFTVNSAVVDWYYLLCYNASVEPMDDPLLREAMNISIDRQSLVDYVWMGQAEVDNGYNFESYGDYYVEDFPEYEYNPERAMELVEQSDYNGETIYYDLQSGYYTLANETAEAVCAMWQAIGIDAQVRYTDIWDHESYHVHNWSNSVRFLDPVAGLWLLWGPGTNTDNYYWQNEETWAEYTAAGETLMSSMDFDERYEANKRLMELWEAELVGTPMFKISEICGVRPGLEFIRTSSPHVSFRAGFVNVVE